MSANREISGGALAGVVVAGALAMSVMTAQAASADSSDTTVSGLLGEAFHANNSATDILNDDETFTLDHPGTTDSSELSAIQNQIIFQNDELKFLNTLLPVVNNMSASEDTNSTLVFDFGLLANTSIGSLAVMDDNDHTINDAVTIDVPIVSTGMFAATDVAAAGDNVAVVADNGIVWHGLFNAGLVPDVAPPDVTP